MGYSHYWYLRNREQDSEKFKAVSEDFRKLLAPLTEIGVELAGWEGRDGPAINPDIIAFNGIYDCGHKPGPGNLVSMPTEDARGVSFEGQEKRARNIIPVRELLDKNIRLYVAALDSRTCDGDCSHEPFIIRRELIPEELDRVIQSPGEPNNGWYFFSCKTAFKPYDIAVTACLIIAKHHLGEDIDIASDGLMNHWLDAQEICESELGYGEKFQLVQD